MAASVNPNPFSGNFEDEPMTPMAGVGVIPQRVLDTMLKQAYNKGGSSWLRHIIERLFIGNDAVATRKNAPELMKQIDKSFRELNLPVREVIDIR